MAIAGAAGAIVIVVLLVMVVPGLLHSEQPEEHVPAPAGSVSFVAVGDNLPDDAIGAYADSLAGGLDDGQYDYAPIYEPIKTYVEKADLAYIDQETHLGGDEIGPQGYPSFNTTDAMADAVVSTGFDVIASATNHSYDWGSYGAVEHSLSVWKTKPVAFTGTADSAERRDELAVVERNGIKFVLLSYTYGVNGYSPSDLPDYAVNFIDEKRIASDVARAKEAADVVLVAMHWGTELFTGADEEQMRLAQFLADLDVDVVLGSHPHVIGPMAWEKNSNGSGHQTLVAYSLGNFLANHEAPIVDNAVEGMLTCDFVRSEPDGPVTIENVKWVPLVCHVDTTQLKFAVYAVKDYTKELASHNRALAETPDPINWLYNRSVEVVGLGWVEEKPTASSASSSSGSSSKSS